MNGRLWQAAVHFSSIGGIFCSRTGYAIGSSSLLVTAEDAQRPPRAGPLPPEVVVAASGDARGNSGAVRAVRDVLKKMATFGLAEASMLACLRNGSRGNKRHHNADCI